MEVLYSTRGVGIGLLRWVILLLGSRFAAPQKVSGREQPTQGQAPGPHLPCPHPPVPTTREPRSGSFQKYASRPTRGQARQKPLNRRRQRRGERPGRLHFW